MEEETLLKEDEWIELIDTLNKSLNKLIDNLDMDNLDTINKAQELLDLINN